MSSETQPEMLTLVRSRTAPDTYELLFAALERGTRGVTFPCDAQGHVDLDALSDSSRNAYFYARAVVGRVFARPAVHRRRTAPGFGRPNELDEA